MLKVKLPNAEILHQYIELLDFQQLPCKLQNEAKFPTPKEIAMHCNYFQMKGPALTPEHFLFIATDIFGKPIKTLKVHIKKDSSLSEIGNKGVNIVNRLARSNRPTAYIYIARWSQNAPIPATHDIGIAAILKKVFELFEIVMKDFILFNDNQFFSTVNWAIHENMKNPFK